MTTAVMTTVPFETFEQLRNSHGNRVSWAVWANPPRNLNSLWPVAHVEGTDFFAVDDQEYAEGIGRALRRDAVIVALTGAERWGEPAGSAGRRGALQGFHDGSEETADHNLRAIAYHFDLWGALITELDHSPGRADAAFLSERLRNDRGYRADCAEELNEVLLSLRPAPGGRLVALGGAVFDALTGEYGPEFTEVLDRHMPTRRVHKIFPPSRWRISKVERILNARQAGLLQLPSTDHLWAPATPARQLA